MVNPLFLHFVYIFWPRSRIIVAGFVHVPTVARYTMAVVTAKILNVQKYILNVHQFRHSDILYFLFICMISCSYLYSSKS